MTFSELPAILQVIIVLCYFASAVITVGWVNGKIEDRSRRRAGLPSRGCSDYAWRLVSIQKMHGEDFSRPYSIGYSTVFNEHHDKYREARWLAKHLIAGTAK